MLLVLSRRYSDDSRLLAEAARLQGWTVYRSQSSTLLPELAGQPCRVYAEGFVAEHFAVQLGLNLLRPPDDALVRLSPEMLGRKVWFCRAGDFHRPDFPAFVKPADQKLFPAAVYSPDEPIPGLDTLQPDDPILVSEPVAFVREYRFFVRGSEVRTGSVYWADGQLPASKPGYEGQDDPLWPEARAFAERVCASADFLPESYVLDVGQLDCGRWAVIEFNPTWASGLYGSSPTEALTCVAASQVSQASSTS